MRQTTRCIRCTTLKDVGGGGDCCEFREERMSLSIESSNITSKLLCHIFYFAGLGLHSCAHFHDKMCSPKKKKKVIKQNT